MLRDQDIIIEQTTRPEDFNVCADIMVGTDPWITLEIDHAQCLKAFDGPLKEIYVLKANKAVVGFVILQLHGTFNGYIQTLAINDAYRGQGLGTRMLKFCEERILQISPNIFICVSSFNHNALRLYTKFGFELVGEMKNFGREGFNELLLRKTFGPVIDYQPVSKKINT